MKEIKKIKDQGKILFVEHIKKGNKNACTKKVFKKEKKTICFYYTYFSGWTKLSKYFSLK